MSWGFKAAGSVVDVQRLIEADTNIPAPVKEMLIVAARLTLPDAASVNYPPPPGTVRGVLIESSGHVQPEYVGSCALKVDAILLAAPAAAPPAAD